MDDDNKDADDGDINEDEKDDNKMMVVGEEGKVNSSMILLT